LRFDLQGEKNAKFFCKKNSKLIRVPLCFVFDEKCPPFAFQNCIRKSLCKKIAYPLPLKIKACGGDSNIKPIFGLSSSVSRINSCNA